MNQDKGAYHLSSTDSSSSKKTPVTETANVNSNYPISTFNFREDGLHSINPEYATSIQNCSRLEKLREDTFVWMVRVNYIMGCN